MFIFFNTEQLIIESISKEHLELNCTIVLKGKSNQRLCKFNFALNFYSRKNSYVGGIDGQPFESFQYYFSTLLRDRSQQLLLSSLQPSYKQIEFLFCVKQFIQTG